MAKLYVLLSNTAFFCSADELIIGVFTSNKSAEQAKQFKIVSGEYLSNDSEYDIDDNTPTLTIITFEANAIYS